VAREFGREPVAVYFDENGAATKFTPGEANGAWSRLLTTLGGIGEANALLRRD